MGAGGEDCNDALFPEVLKACTPQLGWLSLELPPDISQQAVPLDFYGQRLRDFDVETPLVDGRGNSRPAPPPLGVFLSVYFFSSVYFFRVYFSSTFNTSWIMHHKWTLGLCPTH